MVSRELSTLLRAVADPTRRRILERLGRGGLPVSEIAAQFPMSRPAISKHLRILREAGLAIERRHGRQRIYERRLERLELVAGWLAAFDSSEASESSFTEAVRAASDSKELDATAGRSEAEASSEDGDEREWRSW